MKKHPSQATLQKQFIYKNGLLIRRQSTGVRGKGRIAGCITKRGYMVVSVGSKLYYGHRIIWILLKGSIPKGMELDHKNGVPCDNRIQNLRLATPSQNQHNRGKSFNNKAGFKGVCLNKRMGKWHAGIKLNGKLHNLGEYDTPQLAARAYARAARKLHKNFRRLK